MIFYPLIDCWSNPTPKNENFVFYLLLLKRLAYRNFVGMHVDSCLNSEINETTIITTIYGTRISKCSTRQRLLIYCPIIIFFFLKTFEIRLRQTSIKLKLKIENAFHINVIASNYMFDPKNERTKTQNENCQLQMEYRASCTSFGQISFLMWF